MGTGYACPVCATPQRDAEHLANHLAFTAMLRHEGHEEWLDEHVPEWGELGPADLGERVVEFAEETEYEEVFEDTVGNTGAGRGDLIGGQDHGHGHQHRHGHSGHEHPHGQGQDVPTGANLGSAGNVNAEAQAVLDEARELTRQMLSEEGDESGGNEGDEAGDDEKA